jgi:hypothetical protein
LEESATAGNDAVEEIDGSIVVGLWEALRMTVKALFAISICKEAAEEDVPFSLFFYDTK